MLGALQRRLKGPGSSYHQLDYLTKRHLLRKAKAIRVLTILTSLDLPLLLAASLLGMQTPFTQMAHNKTPVGKEEEDRLIGIIILFDFFGMFLWLDDIRYLRHQI